MVDRHAVQEMVSAGMSGSAVAKHFGISTRTVRRIREEAAVESADDATSRRDRGVGRPRRRTAARDHPLSRPAPKGVSGAGVRPASRCRARVRCAT